MHHDPSMVSYMGDLQELSREYRGLYRGDVGVIYRVPFTLHTLHNKLTTNNIPHLCCSSVFYHCCYTATMITSHHKD